MKVKLIYAGLFLSVLLTAGSIRAERWAVHGIMHYEEGNFAESELALDKAIALEQTNPYYYFCRAKTKLKLGFQRGAQVDLSIALIFDPDFLEARRERSITRYMIKDYHGAIDDFGILLKAKPEDAEIWFWYGMTDLSLRQFKHAKEKFDTAIELDDKLSQAWHNRGVCYLKLQKYELALGDLSQAIKLEGRDAAIYTDRAFCYSRLNKQAEAQRDFKKASLLNKKLLYNYQFLSLHHYQQKDIKTALSTLSDGMKQSQGVDLAHLKLKAWALKNELNELPELPEGIDNYWTNSIHKYIRGLISDADLIRRSESYEELIEARFYIGIMHLHRKELVDARKVLGSLADENAHTFEGTAAKLILLNYGLLAAEFKQ